MSEFDLVVRRGLVVDGSGGEPFEADVALKNGRIAAVGQVSGQGSEEIDAKGLLVTPGFVDVHTHYDGQVTWENRFAPSSEHGVTTVVMGNCAVGFAPCKAEHRELLMKLMEGVEEIPAAAMLQGIPWSWESFPQFLDFLATRHCDMDFATQLPHGPLRVNVMGQRAADREPATDDDLRLMGAIVQDSLRAGALGFTTSRTMNHRTVAGALAPTVTAAETELRAIALAMKEVGQGVIETVGDWAATDENGSTEFEMWERIVAASGRPLSFSLVQDARAPTRWRDLLDMVDRAQSRGVDIKGQVCARAIGSLFGLQLSTHPFAACPSYKAIAKLPLAERVARMRDPNLRRRILTEDPEGLSQQRRFTREAASMFLLADPPDYCPPTSESLQAKAQARGVTALELAYDLMLEDGGKAILYCPVANYVAHNFDAVYEMMTSANTFLGIGDGGAHVGRVCDASQPTFVLANWTRGMGGRRLPLQTAVRKLTLETAQAVGLSDRGLLKAGYMGDLNVIDYDRLQLRRPEPRYDFPAGSMRLTQRAEGYVATVKSGQVTYRDGQATQALPGRLIRGRQSAPR